MFTRDDDYMAKICLEALDKQVLLDASVQITYDGGRYRAWCKETKTWLQFPNALRFPNTTYVADVVKAARGSGKVFFRAFPGSIRKTKSSDPVG